MTFKEVQLHDILDIQWGDTKTTKASYVSDGYLAYSATGPDGFLEKFDYDRDGIVLSAIGANCGSTFFATGKWSCIKNTIRMLPKSDAIDLKYFFYMTKMPDFWPIRGSAQPFISQTDIRELHVQIPEISIQKATGEILFTLEEKIAANNALSKTLEDIAQTIFKSWFIDFNPVKAKMAGDKPAGMDAATAALFPDSMVESEVGLIPSGWELRKVEEVLKRITVNGLPKSTVLLNLGRTLVLEQGDSVIAGFIDEDADVIATNDSPAFVFGDHTCRMRLSTIPFSIFPNTIVLTSELINTYWAFGATWGLQNFETYRRHWMELAYKVLVVPNIEVAEVYGEEVKPLFELIDSLMVQNRVLSALRDDLLPRLISGKLQIPEKMLAS